jgi:hypothetical protein
LKSNRRNILFTFDYELFLGSGSGTVKKCLLEPTEHLIALFDKYSVRNAIFFVDTSYLIRLEKEENDSCKRDMALIREQLTRLVQKGHYVFPHIHPHWLDAVYDSGNNQWSLKDYSKYRFHFVSPAEREYLFSESFRILSEIILPVRPGYKISGYRAGGWSLQPFSDFQPFFEAHGISNEFSVVPGFKNHSQAQYFDFSACPQKVIYNFDTDPTTESVNGRFREYTISSVEIKPVTYYLAKVWGKYLWKTGQRSLGDGSGLVVKEGNDNKKRKDVLGSENREMISFELLTSVKLRSYKKFLETNTYMHFISHPKMLSMHNISMAGQFLKFASARFELCTDFSAFNANSL